MGIMVSKFLNTTTHFSQDELSHLWNPVVVPICAAGGVDNFIRFYGDQQISVSGSEADSATFVQSDIHIFQIIVFVTFNTSATASTVVLRVNGVDTGVPLSIPAGATGLMGQNIGDILVSSGSRICLRTNNGGSANPVSANEVIVMMRRAIV